MLYPLEADCIGLGSSGSVVSSSGMVCGGTRVANNFVHIGLEKCIAIQ